MGALSKNTWRVRASTPNGPMQQGQDAHAIPKAWLGRARWWESNVYLIRGQAEGSGLAHIRELVLTLQDGTTSTMGMLVTKKGRMLEMVALGAPPVRVALRSAGVETHATGLEAHASDVALEIRRLTRLEQRYRQVRRVVPALHRRSRAAQMHAGLSWSMLFNNLDYAYSQASRARMGAYAFGYHTWFNEFCRLSLEDRRAIDRAIGGWAVRPHFTIIVVGNGVDLEDLLAKTLASLERQIYKEFSITVTRGDGWQDHMPSPMGMSQPSAPSAPPGKPRTVMSSSDNPDFRNNQWAILLPEGCELAEQALFWIAHLALAAPSADLIYSDHDVLEEHDELSEPAFKPDWSSELLRSANYISFAFAWRVAADKYRAAMTAANRYATLDAGVHALLLTLASGKNVVHVPAPLWHIPALRLQANGSAALSPREGADRVVADYLEQLHVAADVQAMSPTRNRIRYGLPPDLPLISIVIPTRDGMQHLRPCIESIVAKTSYPNIEILVVDNQSVEVETLAYFKQIVRDYGVRICRFDEPFNYSRMNNFAVNQVKGTLVCLLNNDTEVISVDWLQEMAGMLLQPTVGVVGAKLLFADGTVQHAGDAVGPGGCADHLHVGIGRDDPGYGGRALVAQELSAVTAACLLTTVDIYKSLGGLNEKHLPVAFNDVDFCLRVRAAGYRVLWTPHAMLYHHESVSRGKDETPARKKRAAGELRYMRKRWGRVMQHDPYYNPNLNYQRPDFSLAALPRVRLPWIKQ